MLKDPDAAYLGEDATQSHEPYISCQIIDTAVTYLPVQFAYVMPKKSPVYQAFYYNINKLKETGTLQRYAESYARQGQVCPDYSGRAVSAKQSFTASIILIFGASISILWLG